MNLYAVKSAMFNTSTPNLGSPSTPPPGMLLFNRVEFTTRPRHNIASKALDVRGNTVNSTNVTFEASGGPSNSGEAGEGDPYFQGRFAVSFREGILQ